MAKNPLKQMQCTHQTCSRLVFADMGKVYRTMMDRVGPSHWNGSSGQITARQVIEGVHSNLSLWSSMKSPKATITFLLKPSWTCWGFIFDIGLHILFGFCCTFVKPKQPFNKRCKNQKNCGVWLRVPYTNPPCQTLPRNHPLTFVVVSILLCFLQGATQLIGPYDKHPPVAHQETSRNKGFSNK